MDKKLQQQLLETVRKNYDEIADEFSDTRNKPLWPQLKDLANKVKSGSRVLDVGCGNGRLYKAWTEGTVDYTGVDVSAKLLEIAKINHPNAKFLSGDILNLGQIPELNFDFVFSVAVLHHIPGMKLRIDAVKQLKNKVSQHGKIVVVVWNLWSRPKYRKLINRFFWLKVIGKNKMDFGDILFDWKGNAGDQARKRYYHAFTARELKKIFKRADLKIDEFFKDQYNYYVVLSK